MNDSSASDNLTLGQNEIDDLWNNINSAPSDPVSYWVSIASFIFAILGLISNSLSVIVLSRLSAQLATFVYLTGLSLSDMITCISIIVTHSLEYLVQTRRSTSITIFLRYVEIVFGALAAGSRVLSLWISTAVTMDRWVLICYPIYGKSFCTLNRAKVVSRTLFIIALLYSIPLFFEYEIIPMPSVYPMLNIDNESSSLINKKSYETNILLTKSYSDLAKRRLFRWAYMFFNAIFVYTVPIIAIVSFNIQLIRALHRVKSRTKLSRQKNQSNGRNHSGHNRSNQSKYSVTIMVITMVLTLILCRSPTIVIWVLWSFELTIKIFFDSSSSLRVRRFHSIANLIAIINAATNFLPFCVFGQLFRAECLNIYCCRKPANEVLFEQRRKICIKDENNQRIETGAIIRNGQLQNILPLKYDSKFSSVYSGEDVIQLDDSPCHSRLYEQHHSNISSVTTPLTNETIDL